MKAETAAATPAPFKLPGDLRDKLEGLNTDAKPKLAVLLRWAEAESGYDPGGSTPTLDRLAWRGLHDILFDVLRAIEHVEHAADMGYGDYVTIADEKGGGE